MARHRTWFLGLALVAIVAGCATNPVTGRREFSLVSPSQELQMGQEGYKAVVQEYGLYDDQKIQDYVNTVGQKVAKASHQPSLTWHYTVIDDPSVNAFAMPGGYVYITRGILPYLNSEAQLAAVLGHETGHVTHRHTAEQITQQQLYGLGLGVASIVSPTVARYNDVAQQALGLLFLKYSRTDETQADELGVQYSTGAGYDAREMPATYQMLKRISDKSGQSLPNFLSTHPDPGDRETRTRQLSEQATAGRTNLVINHDGYIQRMDGMVFGDDPRFGYFEGDRYYHPAMRFQMAFPTGWKHQDTRASVLAVNADQSAGMQMSVADAGSMSPSQFVQALEQKGSISAADGTSETIVGHPAWVGHIGVQTQGQSATLVAAWIRKDAGTMFQILGQARQQGDANEAAIVSSIRSYRDLTDASKLNVQPSRVRVETVAYSGDLQTVLPRLGVPGKVSADVAIMNNLTLNDSVKQGQLLKVVVPR
jgi:predicted Zn-dependent protease